MYPLDSGEAHHDKMRGHLVEHDSVFAELCGSLAVRAQIFVADDNVTYTDDRVMQDREELIVGIAQLLAAQAHGVPVDHVCGGEIGHHPAIAQHSFNHKNGVTAELYCHEDVEIEPTKEIV